MPHKHKRRAKEEETFDLPPNTLARSLPAGKSDRNQTSSKKRKRNVVESASYGPDDTPAAFKRLQMIQQTGRRSQTLDEGRTESAAAKKKKKRKILEDGADQAGAPTTPTASEVPRILPGERLADFAARVDQAIPISGLQKKGRSREELGITTAERRTRLEKKMHRKYAEWRKEDARRKDKEQELLDLQEEADAENLPAEGGGVDNGESLAVKKRGRRGQAKGEDDPWAELARARGKRPALNDVVQAPPQFDRIPREKFKVKRGAGVDVANVPNAAGSLRKREELSSARRSIIESYRRMMQQRRDD